jgi:hypothetical protein
MIMPAAVDYTAWAVSLRPVVRAPKTDVYSGAGCMLGSVGGSYNLSLIVLIDTSLLRGQEASPKSRPCSTKRKGGSNASAISYPSNCF